MGCCKCVEHRWADPQKVVYTDQADGNEYCIFHAPKGEKWKPGGKQKYTSLELRLLIWDRIDSVKAKATEKNIDILCNLGGTVIPDRFYLPGFNKDNPLPNISFYDCTFCGGSLFFNTCFGGETDFSLAKFNGEVYFLDVTFSGPVIFDESIFRGKVHFKETVFIKRASFCTCEAKDRSLCMIRLGQESLKHLTFFPSDIPLFSLHDSRWPNRLGLETDGVADAFNLLACGELYRGMKQKAAEAHDQPMVSRWHFREKLMQLKALLGNVRSNDLLEVVEDREAKLRDRAKAWLKLLALPPYRPKLTLTGIYWATSGFGERAVRAGVWLLALLLLPFVTNSPVGHSLWRFWNRMPGVSDLSSWVRSIGDAISASAAMEYIPFTKDIKGEGWQKVGQGLWQGAVILQFTLFALALRNRFRR